MEKISIARRRMEVSPDSRLTTAELRSRFRDAELGQHANGGGNGTSGSIFRFPLDSEQLKALEKAVSRSPNKGWRAYLAEQSEGVLVLKIEKRTRGQDRLLSSSELADLLGLSRSSIYRLVRGGQIKALRIGRILRFEPEEINEFLTDCNGVQRCHT